MTVAEDGYLTLRIRTVWGPYGKPHYIDLISGVNPENPFEFELRHDAKGDLNGRIGDGLIVFNLDIREFSDDPSCNAVSFSNRIK